MGHDYPAGLRRLITAGLWGVILIYRVAYSKSTSRIGGWRINNQPARVFERFELTSVLKARSSVLDTYMPSRELPDPVYPPRVSYLDSVNVKAGVNLNPIVNPLAAVPVPEPLVWASRVHSTAHNDRSSAAQTFCKWFLREPFMELARMQDGCKRCNFVVLENEIWKSYLPERYRTSSKSTKLQISGLYRFRNYTISRPDWYFSISFL